jgi:rubrerythrin
MNYRADIRRQLDGRGRGDYSWSWCRRPAVVGSHLTNIQGDFHGSTQRLQDGRKPEGRLRGRIQANRRYLYFANKADVEGQNDVAALFRSTAEGETGHAHGHLEWLEQCGDPATGLPIGRTRDNLKAAVAGETHEYTDMYPGMAKTAREEGFDEVADWFETLAKAERSHANRYTRALNELVD